MTPLPPKETFYKTMARDQPKSPDYRLKRTVQTEEYSRDRTVKHKGKSPAETSAPTDILESRGRS